MQQVQATPKPPPAMLLTEPDFQKLPTSVQRKYFSTLERLQIAQNSLYHCDAPNKPHVRSKSFPARNSKGSLNLRRSRVKTLDCFGSDLVTNAEARWFLSLPEKVRRQHFSKEEQIRLEDQIASSQHLAHSRSTSRNTSKHSATSTHSLLPRTSSSDPLPISSRVFHDSARPPLEVMNCFDGRPSVVRRNSRKPSVRRTLSKPRPDSVSTNLRQPGSSGPSVPQSPATPTFSQHRPAHSRSATISHVRPSMDSTNRSFDPAATYYQDPEARQKLRQYLASPQKFDEAVEFGFPSNAVVPDSDLLFRTHRSTSSNDAQAFLKDEVISFIDRYEQDDSENSSYDGPASPATPPSGDDIFRRKPYGSSIFAGLDSTDIPSLNFKMEPDAFAYRFSQDPLANREMTLRMTLTRPDLRADDEDLYGWTRKEDDPLALEQLPMSDDTTGEHGAFAVKPNRRSGMFKRIFSKVKNER